ncbi:hypothetical protein C0W80_18345 [Photobacterium leiognathi subsp. mandapamensis]|nr:oligosaccharide flippase family protein [Photobacterium leiognathi]PSU96070.1 hypothetical protein C0W80_18345 [Photobacterium leiognathi subsp. mandapamensis]
MLRNKVLKNFFNLAGVQLALTVLQLLLYPYMVKVIGDDRYGQVILMQSYALLLQVLVIFGTDLGAIRSISKQSNSKKRLEYIFLTVFEGRLIIAFFMCILYLIGINIWDVDLAYCFYIFTILEAAFTTKWFFHGLQKLQYYTIPFVLGKSITIILLFLFIKKNQDWDLYPLIFSLTSFMVCLISFFIAKVKYSINAKKIKFKIIVKRFLNSKDLFLTNVISTVKDRTAIIFIAHIIGDKYVVYYDFAYKVSDMLSSLLSSFSASLYPSFVADFKVEKFEMYYKIIFVVSIIPLIILSLFSNEIIQLIDIIIGLNLEPIQSIYWLFGSIIFVRGFGYYIGLCYLMVKGQSKLYSRSLILSGVTYILAMSFIVILDLNGLVYISIGVFVSLSIELIDRFLMYKKIRNEY